ncbi:protein-disulfide reductase DsbD domain-containing protein [Roseivivax sp.]
MIRASLFAAAAALALTVTPAPAPAEELDAVVAAELRPGWRRADGTHIAALHLKLAPGWKTYWRAPGDAGIPPEFGWRGSDNLGGVSVIWPRPEVFDQAGMRSIGYETELVLPLAVRPAGPGDVRLAGDMQLGVCKDICMPHELRFSGLLPAGQGARDPAIVAALADRPFSAEEVGVGGVSCSIAPREGDGLRLEARIEMPPAGREEETVVETGNPYLWVAEPATRREGGTLIAATEIRHMEQKPFALDRSALTFTVLGQSHAVEIAGCG